MLESRDDTGWQHGGIDLQAQSQSLAGGERGDRLMQTQLTAPKSFVSERVETKDLTSGDDELTRIGLRTAEECFMRFDRGTSQ